MKATMRRPGTCAALLLAAAAACTNGDDPDPPNKGVPTEVAISPGSATLGYVNESAEFTAQVFDQNGSFLVAPVSWSVSDTSILTVAFDSTGAVATAVANGSALLLATSGEAMDTATVTVRQVAGGLEIVSGDDQTGLRGATLAEPLVVGVVDYGGTVAAGVEIAFAPGEESGAVSDSVAETDADGRASTEWTLGEARRQSVTASVGDFRLRFSATANSDPPMPDYDLSEGLDFPRPDPLDTDVVEFAATISNLGDGAGPATIPARLTLDGEPHRTLSIERIAPGAAATVTFEVGPLEPGTRQVGLEIDPGGAVGEWDEQNNSAAGTLTVVRQRMIGLGEPVTLESPAAERVFLFRVDVAEASEDALNIQLSGGSGDADIFAHYGERPSYRHRYRCFGVGTDSDELCQMVPARAGAYHVAVHAFTAFGPATLRVTVGDEPPVEPFDIELVFLGGGTGAQRDAVDRAARRWESVIARDVFDWDHAGFDRVPAGTCGPDSPEVADEVDDIRVFVTIGAIDGPGSTTAQSGPCWVRPHPLEGAHGVWLQPTLAALVLDEADVAVMEAAGMLESFATHELAHALGFVPAVWERHDRLRSPSVPRSPGADTHFDGPLAVAAFDAVGGIGYAQAKVPVENGAVEGFSDSHWRESVFGDELMSAVFTGETLPLSLVTVESLYDIGYEVNPAAADTFRLSGAGARVATGGPVIDLGHDVAPWPVRVLRRRAGAGK